MEPPCLGRDFSAPCQRPWDARGQFTAGGFGCVVVRLAVGQHGELTFEERRLTALAALIDLRGDRLPC